mgnify:CR=1 FL=1
MAAGEAAKAVLQEAFALGADEGWLLTDRKFAGADVLATSYTIASGIRQIDHVDLILCGKQTTDGDTAQVGPEMAEVLGNSAYQLGYRADRRRRSGLDRQAGSD